MLAAATAHGQKSLVNEPLDKPSGTEVQVRSVFDPLPPSGYAPVRVVATNGTNRNARWMFEFSSEMTNYRQPNKHASSFPLEIGARSTQSALFLVPMAVGYGGHNSGSSSQTLNVQISNTGFASPPHYDHQSHGTGFPSVALSNGLAEFSTAALDKEVESKLSSAGGYYGRRQNLFGSQFEPDDLPDNWLGYTGFDFVLLSSVDWQKLKPGVRGALLEWVRLGGTLHVFMSPGVARSTLGLPGGEAKGAVVVSLGKVETFEWDGKKLAANETVNRYWGASTRVEDLTVGRTSVSDWPLIGLLGSRSFASWQVIVFLVVFGLLVGPINLFVLAPAGKRHKLFVTTPLLSIGASVLMVALILMQDGTGGVGRRFIAINLEPAEAAAYVTQEQVSRTGVLLGAAFEVSQPALIEPVGMPDTAWVKVKSNYNSQPVELTQEGRERRGNFFQSRAEQGQVLRSAVSTRARLELKAGVAAGEAPVVISALGFTVDKLFYVAKAGAAPEVWTLNEPLSTGQSATLVKADPSLYQGNWAAMITPAEKSLHSKITDAIGNQPGAFFVAKASKAPDFTVETLSSIRWQDDQIVVFGPVAQP